MNYDKFKGTGVAMVTPFNEDESIDFLSLEKIINHLIEGGVNYLVALGTTGESATLDKNERRQLLKTVVEITNGRVPLVAGLGGNNTSELLSKLKSDELDGFDALLSVTPYYNKPNQEGLYRHYSALLSQSHLPVILYNVPGRTGVNMLPATTLKLANEFKNIIGIKEASGNMEQIMYLIKHRPENFLIISGDDNLTFPLMASGADGVISVAAHLFPHLFSSMVNLSATGEIVKAREIHYRHLDLTNLLFADGSPGGVKQALAQMELCKPIVRLPLSIPNDNVIQQIKESVKNF
jgi:4-hydroxy-tetrahydrodipicolinate synthase